jgi:hypothetical protein
MRVAVVDDVAYPADAVGGIVTGLTGCSPDGTLDAPVPAAISLRIRAVSIGRPWVRNNSMPRSAARWEIPGGRAQQHK